MKNKDASTIAEIISSKLGGDTGFVTAAVVAWSTVDGEGQERFITIYDGSLMHAAKLAEVAASRLDDGIAGSFEDG